MKSETKSHILQTAARLFFAEGFATGIDRVTFECATAKMTIYQHFTSKDGLICAILGNLESSLGARMDQRLNATDSVTERLAIAFNLVACGMSDPSLMLGLGVRALIEFPSPRHPVHGAALHLDKSIIDRFTRICADGEPGVTLPQQLLLLAQGCFLSTPLLGLQVSRLTAVETAKVVIAGATPGVVIANRSAVPFPALHVA